jgi:hypothetical protein
MLVVVLVEHQITLVVALEALAVVETEARLKEVRQLAVL